ncbi:hypothetical protein SLEP1_g52386 [Rubroshorea leprosula]|uniref:Uncharacterized protein n=1 Tax=Rubroshorea leprosula TaxID=152421 RepID=A0AAV5M637_9ROSI|nr:hypothetical protein SLEP1_g52386 [Rubroshorea leprosula]
MYEIYLFILKSFISILAVDSPLYRRLYLVFKQYGASSCPQQMINKRVIEVIAGAFVCLHNWSQRLRKCLQAACKSRVQKDFGGRRLEGLNLA